MPFCPAVRQSLMPVLSRRRYAAPFLNCVWHAVRRGLAQERARLVVEDDIADVILIANTLFVQHEEAALTSQ